MTYYNKLNAIAREAEKELLDTLLPDGKVLRFADDEQVNEDGGLSDLGLPIHDVISRHGYFMQFEIFEISRKGADVIVKAKDNGEDGEIAEFSLSELSISQTCELVDYIKSIK